MKTFYKIPLAIVSSPPLIGFIEKACINEKRPKMYVVEDYSIFNRKLSAQARFAAVFPEAVRFEKVPEKIVVQIGEGGTKIIMLASLNPFHDVIMSV